MLNFTQGDIKLNREAFHHPGNACPSEIFTITLHSLIEEAETLTTDNSRCEDPHGDLSSTSHNMSLFDLMSEVDAEVNQVDTDNCDSSPGRSITSLEEIEIPAPQNLPGRQNDLTGSPIEMMMPHLLDHGSYACLGIAEIHNSHTAGTVRTDGANDLNKPDPFMGVSQDYVKTNSFLETFNAASVQMETSTEQSSAESGSFSRVDSQEENLIPLDVPVVQSDSDASVDESFTDKVTPKQKTQQPQDGNNEVLSFESDEHLHQPDNHYELKKQQGLNKKQRKTLICMVEQFKQYKSSFLVSKLPNRATNQHYYKVLKRYKILVTH